jgi:hypothetical protein
VGEQEKTRKTVNVRTRDNVVHGEKTIAGVIELFQELKVCPRKSHVCANCAHLPGCAQTTHRLDVSPAGVAAEEAAAAAAAAPAAGEDSAQ